jgi:hypothetical protein
MSPEEFVTMARKKDMNSLLNVNIEARNEKDGIYHYSYFHVFRKKDTLIIPSFEYFSDLIKEDTVFLKNVVKFDSDSTRSLNEKIEFTKKYTQKIDSLYKDLGVINSKSNPKMGKFIEFTLSNKCNVYYLADVSTLNPYWKDKFSKLKKVDKNWYYECK